MNDDRIADTLPWMVASTRVSSTDFDALMLSGWSLNADFLRVQSKAHGLACQMDRKGKPTAIICARVGQSCQASVDDLHIVKRLFSDT